MKGQFPFNSQFVSEKEYKSPDPIVEYVETIETKSGKYSQQREVVKTLQSGEYIKTHPYKDESVYLGDLLEAGVNLNEVNTKIYEEDLTQKEILSMVEEQIDKNETK